MSLNQLNFINISAYGTFLLANAIEVIFYLADLEIYKIVWHWINYNFYLI